jgi:excisionase family DNA binding protein
VTTLWKRPPLRKSDHVNVKFPSNAARRATADRQPGHGPQLRGFRGWLPLGAMPSGANGLCAGSVILTPDEGDCGKMAEAHEVLTAEEAAALLRVSTKTVLTLARNGNLPGEKVGRAWRFLRSDVLGYVSGSPDVKETAP